MAVKDIFKVSFKTFINPAGWLGLNAVKQNTRTTWDLIKGLFIIPTPERAETFDEAVKRFNLTSADILEREKDYLFYAFIFLVLAVSLLAFGCYLLFVDRSFAGFVLGIAVAALFTSQAFRYHFWYFQMKQRKLGCTFDEWRAFIGWPKSGPKT